MRQEGEEAGERRGRDKGGIKRERREREGKIKSGEERERRRIKEEGMERKQVIRMEKRESRVGEE